MAIHVALGSWADPEYAGLTYPRGFAAEMRLSAYAMWFDLAEVNATYYALPKSTAVAKWLASTPDTFKFNIRLHRVISQSPEKSAKEGRLLKLMLKNLAPLLQARRLGAFLLVLPPIFAPKRHRLEELDGVVQALGLHRLAIELRHSDWVAGETRATTLEYFRSRRVSWVAVDMPRIAGSELMPPIDEVTDSRLAYLRLHGRNPKWAPGLSAAEKHSYAYTDQDLDEIVKRVRSLADRAEEVHVLANNHARDFAPRTALALKEKLGLCW
jgi:uncharacterized protein YecE (DUF72 family)